MKYLVTVEECKFSSFRDYYLKDTAEEVKELVETQFAANPNITITIEGVNDEHKGDV